MSNFSDEIQFKTPFKNKNLAESFDDETDQDVINTIRVGSPFKNLTASDVVIEVQRDGNFFKCFSCGGSENCFKFFWGIILYLWEVLAFLLFVSPILSFCHVEIVIFMIVFLENIASVDIKISNF